MMKLFPLICCLILLLASNAMSRSPPGLHIDTDAIVRMLIRCEVYFDNLTRIHIFDSYLELHSQEHLVASIGKSNETRGDISVSVNASSRGAKDISGSGSAIFTGGFGILEMDHNSLQLNLTPNPNKSVITVTNNTDVEVQWQGLDRLLITPIHRENHGIAGRAEYEVRVRSVKGLKDKVIITLAANGQRVEIDVNYEPENRTAMPTSYDYGHLILGVFILFGIILVILYTPPPTNIKEMEKQDLASRLPHQLSDCNHRKAGIDYVKRTVYETP